MTRLNTSLVRKAALALLLLALVYLGVGLAFHVAWKGAREACRETRLARGEFVEPEVFWWPLGLAFDMTWWPVYAWANVYHFGTHFPPCER